MKERLMENGAMTTTGEGGGGGGEGGGVGQSEEF